MAVAPRYFGRLPRAGCEVLAVEEFKEKDSPFAYYFPPSPDGSAAGIYYANGYDLPSRKYTKLASTTYHEAVPGHHFQIALEMENESLNVFRRLGSRIVGGAYVEGWGLYSERLADEMGLFRDEAERFGMLDAQAWRAARLVVDSGLHALRWPRQRSIDFLLGGGPDRDGRDDRDRPLHRLARPGPDLQDRPARDRAAPRPGSPPATAPVRPARVPRRGARPRVAAARHARARAPELGGDPGLEVRDEAAPSPRARLDSSGSGHGRGVRRLEQRHSTGVSGATIWPVGQS